MVNRIQHLASRTHCRRLLVPMLLGMLFHGLPLAQLQLSVEANPDPAVTGDPIYVKITISNTSNAVSGPIRLELAYPEGLSPLLDAGFSDGADCTVISDGFRCNSGETAFWTLSPIGPGQGKSVSLPPRVSAAAPANIRFRAEVFENGVSRAVAEQSVQVVASNPLTLSATPDQEPVRAGTSLRYTLLVGNQSQSAVRNSELRFPLPAGTSFVAAGSGGISDGSVVTWEVGTLFAGQSRRFAVLVQVGQGAANGMLLQPLAAQVMGELDFAVVTARSKAVTRVGPMQQLALGLEAGPDPLSPGEPLQTRLTITNPSNQVLTGIVVEFLYPGPLTPLLDTGLSNGANCADLTDGFRCNGGELATWNLGTLGPASGRTVFLDPLLEAGTPSGSLVRLQARVRADGVAEVWERKALAVKQSRLLNLSVDPSLEPVRPSSLLEYDLALANQGQVSSRDTLLTFPIPSGTDFLSATQGGTVMNQEVIWNVGLLPAGEGRHFQVTVRVADNSQGTLIESDRPSVQGMADLVLEESRSSAVSRIGTNQRLALAIEPGFDPVEASEHLETRITLSNISTEPLTGLRLEFQFPFEFERLLDSVISDGGNCNDLSDGFRCDGREVLSWNLGTLGPGSGRTLVIPPTVDPSAVPGGLISLRARVSSDSSPEVWERKTVVVADPRPLNLRVDAVQGPAAAGTIVQYDLWYSNRGTTQLREGLLRFPIPEGTSVAAETGQAENTGDALQWDLGLLAPGEGGRLKVRLRLDPAVAEGTLLSADAVTLAATSDLTQFESRAYPVLRSEEGVELSVRLEDDQEAFTAGETVSIDLVSTNRSNSVRTGVQASLFFPVFLNPLLQTAISDAGQCTVLSDGFRCNPRESVIWALGNLAPGASNTVSLSPSIATNTRPGEFLRFFAAAGDDASEAAYTAVTNLVGDLNGDVNGDGRADIADLVSVILRIRQGQVDPGSDCNGDGLLNVHDVRCILELIRY